MMSEANCQLLSRVNLIDRQPLLHDIVALSFDFVCFVMENNLRSQLTLPLTMTSVSVSDGDSGPNDDKLAGVWKVLLKVYVSKLLIS